MKTFHKAPLALAITALMTAPAAFAQEFSASSSIDSTFMNEIDVDLSHSSDTRKRFNVNVRVNDRADYYAGALVDSKQFTDGNVVSTEASENNAIVGSGAGTNATGNVGMNVAAGDNNSQANDAALAANDAADVFGQAEIFSAQHAMGNTTVNLGSPNTATLGSGSLSGASGNIGVNIAAGTSNAQQNSLSASQNEAGGHARATVGGVQQTTGNDTARGAYTETIVNTVGVSVSGTLANASPIDGTYDGTWQQTNNVYPEVWQGGDQDDGHPFAPTYWGHLDFDDADDQANNSQFAGDEEGSVAFEIGEVALSGTLSGRVQSIQEVYIANQNNATLGSNSLQGVSGNIGVNIAAGSNNLQRNSLAIASSMGGGNTGGGGGVGVE